MSWYNRVVWSEGQFLLPQYFQQQERYLEHFVNGRAMPLSPFFWGFSDYDIDREALHLGKLILKRAAGVFQDGAPFNAPGHTPLPPALTIQPEHLEQVICLAVPIRTPESEETSFDNSPESLARFAVHEADIRDANSVGLGAKLVQLSHLRLRLMPQNALTDAWIGLPITRIQTIRADGGVMLDEELIPPVNGYTASPWLFTWISRICELTSMRAVSLAERLTGNDGKGSDASEVSDYLLLQILNRYEPLLRHLLNVHQVSPETLYRDLVCMAGELSTYVRPKNRRPLPPTQEGYQHLSPWKSFRPVLEDLQWLLNAVLIRSAQSIPLADGHYGIKNAVVDPDEIRSFSSLVVAVTALMSADVLVQNFALQTKIGPSERLPELIRSHLPGITLQALPVPPRQIPFKSGYVYYEITRHGEQWDHIARYGGLAMYVAGEFPGLMVELWGVRDK